MGFSHGGAEVVTLLNSTGFASEAASGCAGDAGVECLLV